ncbi:hypothetical protein PM10SUCC1_18290 [Propionigenium maris DSM 9537]|uniref:CHAD domain-containing protein n=1 Tax=Propionigenium maris DSM 9537 TaxID=1123000 RepID=A0A9W6LNU9_9FUSO|nr:CHAD domain-containing protein [Propionigenium maris]GLI56315.1 hypothetical protein PM10SUCC1_18290 [Propionigenium maris DSM 9537]
MYSFKGFFKYLEKQGRELEKNLMEVGISRDPEVVHRCRVAIRRLRATLGLFQCDPTLLDEIKDVAQTLGPLRDIEVQLEFLRKAELPLREKKSILQEKLLKLEIERLRISGLNLTLSSAEFLNRVSQGVGRRKISPYKIYKNLVKRSRRVVENLSQEPFENYHRVRIDLKKIRYLLEAVEVVEGSFKDPIDHLKKFQDSLGEIHDMVVWLQEISGREDLPALRKTLQEKRNLSMKEFNEVRGNLYNLLENILNTSAALVTGKKPHSQELLSLVSSPKEKEEAAEALALHLSPDPSHIQRVANKCRTLYSVLKERVKLTEEDLHHLYCAALLHDIGHYLGGEEHHRDSYTLIVNSSCLPLNISEREAVAILARNHRKKPDFTTNLLNKREVERLKPLSGILRCADGMEMESYEYVGNFTLTSSEGTLTFRGGQISPLLQDRFRRKSSYLAEVLGLKIKYIEVE